MQEQTALRKWLAAERGRAKDLAAALDVFPSAITQWADGRVPAERIFQVERFTGIPIKKLRPDMVKP